MTSRPQDNIQPVPAAVRLAANHVGVSARRKLSPRAFLAALADQPAPDDAAQAVATFLNEADPAEIADLVACGATTFEALAAIARRTLPVAHPNRVHLEHFIA